MEIVLFFGPYLLFSYLIGSVPFGLLLPKIFGHGDIRKIGSGNIGATNVLRTGSKKLAALTLLLDAGKGAFVVLVIIGVPDFLNPNFNSTILGINTTPEIQFTQALLLALFTIIGHCYPIWLKFKGGKGVATALGALIAALPIAGLAACGAWLIAAKITKTSSLSALIAIAIAPIVTLFAYGSAPASICILITLLVWWRHRENIKRLIAGTEPKIGAKKKEEENNPQS